MHPSSKLNTSSEGPVSDHVTLVPTGTWQTLLRQMPLGHRLVVVFPRALKTVPQDTAPSRGHLDNHTSSQTRHHLFTEGSLRLPFR